MEELKGEIKKLQQELQHRIEFLTLLKSIYNHNIKLNEKLNHYKNRLKQCEEENKQE